MLSTISFSKKTVATIAARVATIAARHSQVHHPNVPLTKDSSLDAVVGPIYK